MTQVGLCPNSEDWQRYLLDPEIPARQELGKHLEDCRQCRFLIEQLRQELSELKQEWSEGKTSGVIYMAPLTHDATFEGPATTLLAAKGDNEAEEAASITLSSPDQALLLHAVRDPHSKDIWLYLKSDDPATCRNVLIKPFGSDQDMLTDNDGRINLGDVEWPKPEAMTAKVQLPRATFTLSQMENLADPGSSAVLDSPGGDRIKVSLTGKGRNRRLTLQVLKVADTLKDVPLKVAIRSTDTGLTPRIQSLTMEETSFDDVTAEGTIEIYFFQ